MKNAKEKVNIGRHKSVQLLTRKIHLKHSQKERGYSNQVF